MQAGARVEGEDDKRHPSDFALWKAANLSKDPGEQNNVADQFPEIVSDLEARLIAYAKEMKPSEWIKAQPAFLGAQSKTIFDQDFDIDDNGLPHEKLRLPR